MDPINLIASSPPEWMPILILIALGIKAWQWYVLSRNTDEDNNTPALG